MQKLQLAKIKITSAVSIFTIFILTHLHTIHFNITSNFSEATVNVVLKYSIKILNSTCVSPYYNNVSLFSRHYRNIKI